MTCNYSINPYCEYALKCFNPQDAMFNGKNPELTKRMSGENLTTFRFPFHFIEQFSVHFALRVDRHVYFRYSKNSHFSTLRYTAFPLTRLRHTMHILGGVRLLIHKNQIGAQWLSGRVLNSRPKGRGFEPHRCHCVVVLEQDTFILA